MRDARNNFVPRTCRRGTVLIVAMIVTFALAGTVLVLCRTMRVEVLASANLAAEAQASAVARGAEQYVIGLLTDEGEAVRDLDENYFSAVPVGDGLFWIMRPVYEDDPDLPLFGLVEESAKCNVDRMSNDNDGNLLYERLMRLPGMTDTAANSLVDWVDSDNNVHDDGAEMDFYLNRPQAGEPYYPKNGRLETVEELLLVRGWDRVMLYGDGTASPLGQRTGSGLSGGSSGGVMLDRQLARGIFDLITRYSREPQASPQRIELTRLSNNNYKTQIRDRLRQRLTESRAQEIVDKLDARPNDIFDLAVKGGLKSDELDQVADDFIGRSTGGGQPRGRINPMRAPRAVLLTLRGIAEPDVDKLLASRRTLDTRAGATTSAKIGWVMDSLGEKAVGLGDQITGRTYQWSADICAVSGNGRAFKRVRIVVDIRSGTPTIVYRRDLTARGFPMDKQLLADIRAGRYAAPASAFSPMASSCGSRF